MFENSTAKKVLLSLGVMVCFVFYVLLMRHSDDAHVVVAPHQAPSPSTTTPDPGTTNSPPPTTGPSSMYKDGTYVGNMADAFYGYIQVEAIIHGGKITDVQFLRYPNDRSNSIEINQQAMPYLKEEAIQAQSAQVDGVTGATDTSQAFVESLASALAKAQNA